MSVSVFVLDKHHKPLMPCHPARARKMLKTGRARIHKLHPFTIRLVDRELETSVVQPVEVKIDPGSRETGIAVVRKNGDAIFPLYFINLEHRGQVISMRLKTRSAYRRGRRSRNLRYRAKRFDNRKRADGWLPPSLRHRVDSTISWVKKLCALCPVTSIAQELVKFDIQKMQNPEISGVEYQQGDLQGCEVREYLLEKFGRKCVYCGKENAPLEIDHVIPKSRGGSNRISNLVLACHECNQAKSNRALEDFCPEKAEGIKKQLKTPLRDAASVNATRWKLYRELQGFGLPVSTGSGARTKFNRKMFNIPKEHWLDALCVGHCGIIADGWQKLAVLHVKCTGRGSYQRTRVMVFPLVIACERSKYSALQQAIRLKPLFPKARRKAYGLAGLQSEKLALSTFRQAMA